MRYRCGFALVLVVVVLAALVAVGLPLVAAMGYQKRLSEAAYQRQRARLAAEAALNHAVASLWRTHTALEREKEIESLEADDGSAVPPEGGAQSSEPVPDAFSTPDYDQPSEFAVSPPSVEEEEGETLSMLDSHGEIAYSRVEDENGRVNLNSASPWLMANLFGYTVLTEDLSYADREVPVADASFLFTDDDPETIDGFVRIGNEYIAYRDIENNVLKGCLRGLFLDPRKHRRGELVHDGRPYKIASHRTEAARGRLFLFETPQSVRDVARWTRFSAVAEALKYRRLFAEQLKEYGVSPEDLEDAEIDPTQLDPPEGWERPHMSEDVEALLRKYGIDPDEVEGGMDPYDVSRLNRITRRMTDGMNRIMQRMQKMQGKGSDDRKKSGRNEELLKKLQEMLAEREETFKGFLEAVEEYYSERRKFLNKFYPEAVKNLGELRRLLDVETLDAFTYQRLAPYVTTFSYRPRDWTEPAVLVADVPSEREEGFYDRRTLVVRGNTRFFGRGTIVRVWDDGNEEYGIVSGRGGSRIVLESELQNDYVAGQAWVSALIRHPVNINACDDRVLKALLVGLRFRQVEFVSEMYSIFRRTVLKRTEEDEMEMVTPEEADRIIERIRATPPTCHEDLRDLLQAAVDAEEISDEDAMAVFINAVNANSPALAISTAPFCYHSHDVFRIDAYGIINAKTGEELARCHLRAVVQVSPPQVVKWTLTSQQDLCDGYVLGYDRRRHRRHLLQFPDRQMNWLVSSPIPLVPPQGGSVEVAFPSRSRDPVEGDLRILTCRMPDADHYNNHFDQSLEGVEASPMAVNVSKVFPTRRLAAGVTGLAPAFFACWFKPNWSGGQHYFFDTGGLGHHEDRICLFYDGTDLVLRVGDPTMDDDSSAELRAPYQFQPNQWYHIACSWRGVRFGQLSIWVDGKPVGVQNNYTRLTADVDDRETLIPVEDAAALGLETPDPASFIRPPILVGDEVMEVVEIRGNTLVVRSVDVVDPQNPGKVTTRRVACRGTRAAAHERCSIVQPFGYAVAIGAEIPVGGATLAHDLPNPTPMTLTVRPRGADPRDPSTWSVGATENVIPVESTAGFPQEGVILLGTGEMVHYGGLAADSFINCRRGAEGTTPAPIGPGTPVRLVSLGVSKTDDYDDTGIVQIGREWISYRKAKDAELKDRFLIMDASGGGRVARPQPVQPGRPLSPEQIRQILDRLRRMGVPEDMLRRIGERMRNITPEDMRKIMERLRRMIGPGGPGGFNPGGTLRPRQPGGSDRIPRPRRPFVFPWSDDPLEFVVPQGTLFQQQPPRLRPVRPGPVQPGPVRPGQPEPVQPPQPGPGQPAPAPAPAGPGAARGWMGTARGNHRAGAKVIPVFRVSGGSIGDGDMVTLIDHSGGTPAKAHLRVRVARSGHVGLNDFLPRHFQPSPYGRVLKFPSGLLPTTLQPQGFVAACAYGNPGGLILDGYVDEVSVHTRTGSEVPLGASVDAGGTNLGLRQPGIYRVGDEIVVVTPNVVARGAFGTTPDDHAAGTTAYRLPFPSICAFEGPIPTEVEDWTIPMRVFSHGYSTHLSTGFIACYSSGAQFLGVLPYQRRGMRFFDVYGRPCFDSAFGAPSPVGAGPAFGVLIPYRYYDLYQRGVYCNDGVLFEAVKRLPRAFIRRVGWDAVCPEGTMIRVLVRVDGRPAWDGRIADPRDEIGKRERLFEFTDPAGDNLVELAGDDVEIRVFFTFLPGAWEQGLWKQTPILKGISVEYVQQPVVLFLETLPK